MASRLRKTGGLSLRARAITSEVIGFSSTPDSETSTRLSTSTSISVFAYARIALDISTHASDEVTSAVSAFWKSLRVDTVSYTHLRAHETGRNLVCRLLLEKKKK